MFLLSLSFPPSLLLPLFLPLFLKAMETKNEEVELENTTEE